MSSQTYKPIIRILHSLLIALIGAEFIFAWIMPGLRRTMTTNTLLDYHMSFGIAILPLAALLIILRIVYAAPRMPESMSRIQTRLATIVHWALYALLFLLPLSGWAYASARGIVVHVFGLISLPLIATSNSLLGSFGELHSFLATLIGIIIIGHAAAALYHHFIDKDNVLVSMFSTSRPPTP